VKTDEIIFEILEDGTIKMSTNKISAANHLSAGQLLEQVQRLAGGPTTRESKRTGSLHTHIDHHHHA